MLSLQKKPILKIKKGVNFAHLRHIFVNKRKLFDRAYRKEKRQYLSGYQSKLSDLKTKDPKKFWQEISNLGPNQKKDNIPQEVILNDGNITSNIKEILHKWETDYKKLFDVEIAYNHTSDEFINRVKETLKRWDSDYRSMFTNMNVDGSSAGNNINDNLNREITRDEVNKALKLLKNGKAVGIDNIPNEVLK